MAANGASAGKRSTNEQKKPARTKNPKNKTAARNIEANDLEALEQHRDAGKAQWSLSENTTSAYAGQVKRAKGWLAALVDARRAAATAGEASIQCGGINLDELSKAFDEPPNRYAPYALELLLTEKCIVEGKSISTAQSTYAAMKNYWKTMPGGKYRGKWTVNETTMQVSGNPADAPDVQDILHAIQNKMRASGGRDHAEAITIEDMHCMMQWSERCVSPDVDWASADITDISGLLQIAKHLSHRAFMATAFTLWTRNAELCELQRRHYKPNCTSSDPYRQEFDEITLENRKGWTSTNGNASAACQGHKYELYDQKSTPEIDGRHHLRVWIHFLETKLLRRPLRPNEFIFPVISNTGLVYANKPIDHNVVQKSINEFASGAGLTTQFTTHSFRRGGAQYRFMFCPIGERWSLSAIRWWGGWAKGEHAETLVKYLINELSSYEASHSDALASFRRDASRQFMGNHLQVIPGGTTAELRAATQALNHKVERLEGLADRLSSVLIPPTTSASGYSFHHTNTQATLQTGIFQTAYASPSQNYPGTLNLAGPQIPWQAAPSTHMGGPSAESYPYSQISHGTATPWAPSLASPFIGPGLAPVATHPTLLGSNAEHHGTTPTGTAAHHSTPTSSPHFPPAMMHLLPAPTASLRSIPAIADAVIAKLPRGEKGWKEAVAQWNEPDPRTGIALKDWPREWYKGDMRLVNGTKYGQRRDIALEYIRMGSNEPAFLKQYPEAVKGVRVLVEAIRKQHISSGSRAGRNSKNGTPADRAQSLASELSDGCA